MAFAFVAIAEVSKMKYILFLSFFLLTHVSYSQLDSMKGKVRVLGQTVSYTETYLVKGMLSTKELDFGQTRLDYSSIFDEFSRDLFPRNWMGNYEKEYNVRGQILQSTSSTGGSKKSMLKSYYLYDAYGNMVQKKLEYSSGNYEVLNYQYRPLGDSVDLLMSELNYESDPSRFRIKNYFYNNRFLLVEQRESTGFGSQFKTSYQYDTAGRITGVYTYRVTSVVRKDSISGIESAHDSLDDPYQEYFVYNAKGLLSEKIMGCAPDLFTGDCQKIVFKYDAHDKLIGKSFFWRDSLSSHKRYYYGPDNLLIRIEWFFRDEDKSGNYAEYFYTNRELAKVVFTNKDEVTVFEFKYVIDKNKNWIEQVKLVDSKPFYIRKRKIVYWE